MDRELYNICSEVLERSPKGDPELGDLLDRARHHALKALEFERDEERRNYERDQEVYMVRKTLEKYDSVKNEVIKTRKVPYPGAEIKLTYD